MRNIREVYALASARYNEFAPVNALPTELLSKIFENLAWMDPENQLSESEVDWVNVMLVCQRWRSVALQTPKLWTRISFDGGEPLGSFLERSRGSSLHVFGHLKRQDETQISRIRQLLAPPHLARLNKLEVDVYPDPSPHILERTDDVVAQILSEEHSYAPQLEVLSLESPQTRMDTKHIKLSFSFISSRAPNLRELRLTSCFFPWDARSSSLRSLTLIFKRLESQLAFPFTLDDILKSLAVMPNLEKLETLNSLPALKTDGLVFIDNHEVVHMPRLSYLALNGEDGACWELWALLETHPSAVIDVKVYRDRPVEVIAAALSRHTQRLDYPPYVELKLDHTNDGLDVCLTAASPHSSIRLLINVRSFRQSIQHILRVMPLEGLEALAIAGYTHSWDFEGAASCLATAISVRRIELSGTICVANFCSLFLPFRILYEDHPSFPDIPLAKLEEVHITEANLTTRFMPHPDFLQPIGGCFVLALKYRHERECGLRRLVVKQCNVRKGLLQACENLVEQLDWDGEEAGMGSTADSDDTEDSDDSNSADGHAYSDSDNNSLDSDD